MKQYARAWVAAVGLAAVGSVHGAELFVGTEYIYPTAFDVTPIVQQRMVGGQTVGFSLGGLVTPSSFEMRQVGVRLYVEAVSVDTRALAAETASFDRVDHRGNTALMLAAAAGDLPRVRTLLAGGEAVNAWNLSGSTALMGAASGGFLEVVDLLLEHGADVNTPSRDGSTALIYAARNGHAAVAGRLVGRGAVVDAADREGRTALLHAVSRGWSPVVRLLVGCGADPLRRDRQGDTPLLLAEREHRVGVVALLQSAPAP